jgi:hypothetical protein
MTAAMIGGNPLKGSHTDVAFDPAEVPLGELTVRSSSRQAARPVEWVDSVSCGSPGNCAAGGSYSDDTGGIAQGWVAAGIYTDGHGHQQGLVVSEK